MNRKSFGVALLLSATVVSVWAAGCGDDEVFESPDSGEFDGAGMLEAGPTPSPVGIVVPDCSKGYVLRYASNKIAVIDTAKVADGGGPESYVDLASLLQPEDPDGHVEMTGAVYVPSKKRIYVLLGNVDF